MKENAKCSICGEVHERTDLTNFDNQLLCADCLNELTSVCSRCGARVWNSNCCEGDDLILCESCYDHYYTTCDDCGRIIPNEDVYYTDEDDEERSLCWNCYERAQREDREIHDYYYKPTPIFFGNGPRYFGVELEIDGGGEISGNARDILGVANSDGKAHLYCKHDGSLEDGFELVSHPMSVEYHLNQMPWPEILQEARRLGYCSHQGGTCGLHIHVSRDAFGRTPEKQDAAIARVLYFVEKHWEEILKFSRRTPRQLERWASRYGYKEKPREILEHAKLGYHGGRYTCVNLENSATIEFRMFRGTLKLNTFLATLQFVNRICDVALFMSDEELKAMSWTTFVVGCTQPELVQYLKERRIYINEPVDTEEEV